MKRTNTCTKKSHLLHRCYLLAFWVTFSGCTTPPTNIGLSDKLSDISWKTAITETHGIHLATARHSATQGVLRVYIEGDGRAYLSRSQVSGDPTPLNPIALQLAKADGGNVLYLARPCQYVQAPTRTECRDRNLYTTGRWSETAIAAYTALLTPYTANKPLELVGYSGGAYIALAVAGRLPAGSVQRVITVAGNLSPNAVFTHHHVSKVETAPLNWQQLGDIPQLHYVGSRDAVIPASLKDSYVAEAGEAGTRALAANRWHWITVDADHGHGWETLSLPD